MRAPRFVTLLVAVTAPALAQAQGMPGAGLPMGLDIGKQPVGSFCDYDLHMPNNVVMKQRVALVGRVPQGPVVELTSAGGPLGAGEVTVKVTIDPDPTRPDRVKKLIIQLGRHEPMNMPTGPEGGNQITQLDPRKQVGQESITVPAGKFKTRHFRDKAQGGSITDIWISDDAPPFGLVKLQTDAKAQGGAVTMVLKTRGRGAVPKVTRPAQPFDQQALMKMLQGFGGNAARN